MGLSTTYANIILFVLILTIIYVLMSEFSDYFTKTTPEVKYQGKYLKERLDTSILLSSVTTDGNDVILYVINDGKTTLDVNCTDLYVDREWIKPSDIDERLLLNTTFDPGLWNPEEWVRVTTTYPTDDGQAHEAKLVTCNGVSDSMIFYHTT